jgi:hypothetical protein
MSDTEKKQRNVLINNKTWIFYVPKALVPELDKMIAEQGFHKRTAWFLFRAHQMLAEHKKAKNKAAAAKKAQKIVKQAT